ncbi:MAG TPA: hypothetical protein VFK21_12760 [Gammaproteobacteria bacterium]|nr:hypothetical protein [Gammaproteobacteria bacterium]
MQPNLLALRRAIPDTAVSAFKLLLHPWVLFVVVSLAVWWPDGFNIGPVNDGWIGLGADNILPDQFKTRVFNSFFFRDVGMHLVSNSFLGWEAVLFVATVLRGVLAYEIIKRLFPGRALFAVACGLIALYHPADNSYFWLDAVGIPCGLACALASILAAMLHLQSGSRASLLAMYALQLLTCFNYTAFLPLVIMAPVLIWLVRRLKDPRTRAFYLFKTSVLVGVFIVFQAYLASRGVGREGVVIDLSLRGIIAGYEYVVRVWLHSRPTFTITYLLVALVPGVFAYVTAGAALVAEPEDDREATHVSVGSASFTVSSFLCLAAASYLPYAVSTLRFNNERQLLAAGFFLYATLLLPVFFVLLPRFKSRYVGELVVAVLAVLVTVTGLQARVKWMSEYRTEEGLLAALATTIPDPPPGSTIIVYLAKPYMRFTLAGFYNRRAAFEQALHMMYGDANLQAGFVDLTIPPFSFTPGQVRIEAARLMNSGLVVPYEHLILVYYTEDGDAYILQQPWLQKLAPKGTDLSGYRPGSYGSLPSDHAIMCTMLEQSYRPPYCTPSYKRTSQ